MMLAYCTAVIAGRLCSRWDRSRALLVVVVVDDDVVVCSLYRCAAIKVAHVAVAVAGQLLAVCRSVAYLQTDAGSLWCRHRGFSASLCCCLLRTTAAAVQFVAFNRIHSGITSRLHTSTINTQVAYQSLILPQ